jgi:hypothetical protein
MKQIKVKFNLSKDRNLTTIPNSENFKTEERVRNSEIRDKTTEHLKNHMNESLITKMTLHPLFTGKETEKILIPNVMKRQKTIKEEQEEDYYEMSILKSIF